ncbi:tail fiber protein [Paraburkholderia guartelaensis]|uniref:Tail fiber protein n=1 Tax=Paraburkholderia guartelaensis TaxID=2546446 RepID=A0ABU9SKK8_9BURK
MAGTLITVTDIGRAALVAQGNDGTTAHKVVEIGLATAPFAADKAMKALPGERKRIKTFAGENVAADTIHVTLKDDTADQFTLYGFGLYLENGVLVAAYGQATPIMEKSPDALLLLSADMQFATIDAAQLVFGDASFTNPPATAQRQGVIQLATLAEVNAGADAAKAVTPATLKPRLDAKADLAGADFTGRVSTTDSIRLASAPGSGATLAPGNGDNASSTINNVALRSSFGIGLGPSVDGMSVPKSEFSHWFDTRTGNAGFRGALDVGGLITAQTPPAADASRKVATTEWVLAAVTSALVGQIVFEARTIARAGFLKLNGALLNRVDYPALWAYAQASGAIVTEAQWSANNFGCFSTGNGTTTFRIPELRGEFLRCLDDGRGTDANRAIGSWQAGQNASHAHGASASGVGDHAHSAWTDAQGWHGHGVNDPGHSHPAIDISSSGRSPYLGNGTGEFSGGGNTRLGVGGNAFATYGAGVGIWLNGDGTHGHNIGVGGAGNHSHAITVNADGGNEARPRNVALLAMIRAF